MIFYKKKIIMKKLIYIALILLTFNSYSYQEEKEEIINNPIYPQESEKLIYKNILFQEKKFNFFTYKPHILGDKDNLFVIFHGGKNNIKDFLKNTGLHNKIISDNQHLVAFNSTDGVSWFDKGYNLDKDFVSYVLSKYLSRNYKKVYVIGYSEGSSFFNSLLCDNPKISNNITSYWNINGYFPKDCTINKNIDYNFVFGTSSNYFKPDNFLNYEDHTDKILKENNCVKIKEENYNGRENNKVYMKKYLLNCKGFSNINIYKVYNLENNFIIDNYLDYDDFQGNTLENYFFYEDIIK
tara:strand:+ start:50856 stop:51743 length:888 start_codon:yes stop_codon:yes gene_type:complete